MGCSNYISRPIPFTATNHIYPREFYCWESRLIAPFSPLSPFNTWLEIKEGVNAYDQNVYRVNIATFAFGTKYKTFGRAIYLKIASEWQIHGAVSSGCVSPADRIYLARRPPTSPNNLHFIDDPPHAPSTHNFVEFQKRGFAARKHPQHSRRRAQALS